MIGHLGEFALYWREKDPKRHGSCILHHQLYYKYAIPPNLKLIISLRNWPDYRAFGEMEWIHKRCFIVVDSF
jgi:hypothetical protein